MMSKGMRKLVGVLGLLALLGGCFWLAAAQGGVPPDSGFAAPWVRYAIRVTLVAVALVAWFWTQSLIGNRPLGTDAIGDGLHDLTGPLHAWFLIHHRAANATLIASSAFIDLFGLFILGSAVMGASLRPLVALLLLFAFRQACQGLCALQAPKDMIWRNPGFPSLLVTYGVANDFFISGHTAVAVLGAMEMAHVAPWWVGLAAGVVALLEGAVVIVLRAHYTMDVLGAVVAAVCASHIAAILCS
jgi:hypothetical protein